MDFHVSTPLNIIQRFLSTHLRGGSIVALHDNEKTAGRIGLIIHMLAEILREKGWHAVALPHRVSRDA
ncbi:MAG: hypothetical protein QHI48_03125 [Bacteroidota bacterium]|nr:hypothetical protein [Bacteroidota bacterium]